MSRTKYNKLSWGLAKLAASLAPALMAQKLRNPIFFIGCGRSGTTLLSGILARHPQISVYPTEANELWHPKLYPWHSAALKTAPFWFNAQQFTALSVDSRQTTDDVNIKASFGAYQFFERANVFINKSVMITFMVPKILTLFPDGRFIHIIRDGRAVALSYAIKEKKKIEQYSEYAKEGFNFPESDLLERFAMHWQDHVLEIDRLKEINQWSNNDQILELSYESLCANPNETLYSIWKFLGVATDLVDPRNVTSIKNMNYKFQEKLDNLTVEQLTELIGPTLKKYGYPVKS